MEASSRARRAVGRLASIAALMIAAFPPAASGAPATARQPVRVTRRFAFYSDFEFNLYDALLRAAAARAEHQPEGMEGIAGCFENLSREERSAWNEAVDYFATNVAATSTFSHERLLFRSALAELPIEMNAGDEQALALGRLFLAAAAPAYRACRWQHQDEVNRRWIDALVPRLERHGEAMVAAIEDRFGEHWRRWPIPVDVVETGGWAGADTIDGPQTHIQISSTADGYLGDNALEMIFHEASHELLGWKHGAIADALWAASRATDVRPPRDLWHAVLFVTVGEVTRRELAATGETSDYRPVAEAVLARAWPALVRPLHTAWLPYVRGHATREQAARALFEAIAEETSSPEVDGH